MSTTDTDDLCGLLPFPAEHPAWAALLIQLVELIQGILAKTQCAKRTEFVAKWNPSWSP